MSEKFEKNSIIVLDSGVLISYLMNEYDSINDWLEQNIFNDSKDVDVFCHRFALTELFYVICRKKGRECAEKAVLTVKKHIISIDNNEDIHTIAALIKCRFSIALGDCYSLATAKFLNCPILFKKEQELNSKSLLSIKESIHSKISIISDSNGHVLIE